MRLLVLLLLPCFALSQTYVIAKRNNGIVYLGADSKTGFLKRDIGLLYQSPNFSTTCKIATVGKVTFATIGAYPELQKNVAESIFSKDINPNIIAQVFSRELVKTFNDSIEVIKKNDYVFYETICNYFKTWLFLKTYYVYNLIRVGTPLPGHFNHTRRFV